MEIKIDMAKGSPLTVFPTLDFGELEFEVLILPIAVSAIYAFSLVLKSQNASIVTPIYGESTFMMHSGRCVTVARA